MNRAFYKTLQNKLIALAVTSFVLLSLPLNAVADDLNSGDTAWMLTATALVLFMTIPGLALFYSGLVRAKNVLSVMMHCFAITCLCSVLWFIFGYSIAFGGEGAYWGGLDYLFMKGMSVDSMSGTIPESVFVTFQMTFAIITPALIVGAFAERMKFLALMFFVMAWLAFVYAPICHWVWGDGGWLGNKGILDFAGGTVVHINAGVAGLVAALMVGARKGYPSRLMPPHNLGLTFIGGAMLWVGWFGFNAGSQLAADNVAGMAMFVTQIAAATAGLSWMFVEWLEHKSPSVLGIVTGAVGGLVAITPASGSVGPIGAFAIGIAAGIGCYYGATRLKHIFGYDDSLDVFGVHGIGGIIGALLTGVFCAEKFGGAGFGGEITSIGQQVMVQAFGVVATILYTAIVSFIILKVIDLIIGLRVTDSQEIRGLDRANFEETGYNFRK
ncbi:MAG: Amt family ammonium transporter [Enterobacterales bacterium]